MYARFRNVRGIVADLALPATAKVRKNIFMRISTVTIMWPSGGCAGESLGPAMKHPIFLQWKPTGPAVEWQQLWPGNTALKDSSI